MIKKALTLLIIAELTACIYLLAFCRPAKQVYVHLKPSDKACYDYVNRENMAWLENLAKNSQFRDSAKKVGK